MRREPPRAIRRAVSEAVAREVSASLLDVVEAGTGQAAGMGVFRVAGKTGTAWRVSGGQYESGSYTASFAGFFPAEDPQVAFLVKLDQPRGEYYGGLAAAPVTRATLAAALAASSSVLDRSVVSPARNEMNRMAMETMREGWTEARTGDGVIGQIERRGGAPVSATGAAEPGGAGATAGAGEAGAVPEFGRWLPPAPGPFIFALDASPPERYSPTTAPRRTVPEVEGLALRDAARRLHGQGFRVEIEGRGAVIAMSPAAGSLAEAGSVVRLRGREVE